MRLKNKVAVVTGAGSGIGRAITELYLQEGAKVVAGDINEASLRTLVTAQNAGCLTIVVGNVANEADAEALIETAIKTYGRIDILVNNAGILDNFKLIHELDNVTWDRVLAVNLTGPMYTSRRTVQAMMGQGGGVIVNVASIGGLFGARAGAAYTASKHGLIGLTRNIAFQYAKDGIRCNAIAPGGVATNIGADASGFSQDGYKRSEATFGTSVRIAAPTELASVAVFLACEELSFVNGEVLVADGGWTAG